MGTKSTEAQELFELCKSKPYNWYYILKHFSQIEKVEVDFIKGYPCRLKLYFLNWKFFLYVAVEWNLSRF